MYEAKQARIDELRSRFDREVGERAPAARTTAEAYLEALTDLIRAYEDGPAADPETAHVDTTGEVRRAEDRVVRAEGERHRVRRAMEGLR